MFFSIIVFNLHNKLVCYSNFTDEEGEALDVNCGN